jgi:hypothetical protein
LSGCRSRRSADTLPGMRVRGLFVIAFLIAAACGGDADAGPAPGDYFAQLQRVSETAHIQERGLRRDLGNRLDEAAAGEDRMTVLTVFVDQSVRLYADVVDALRRLDPPQELAAVQQSYLEAWRGQLDAMRDVRDGRFHSPAQILKQFELPLFTDAAAKTKARCEELQAAVAASGSDVDLVCDGRPA